MFSQIFSITWKVIVVIISCYVAIAFLINFLKPKKIDYVESPNYAVRAIKILLRPVTDLAFEQKLSQESDWNEIQIESFRKLESDGEIIKFKNEFEKTKNNILETSWWDLKPTSKSVILQPEDTSLNQNWILVRCFEKSNTLYCSKSNFLINDLVKTEIFKEEHSYLGLDKNGNYIKLKEIQQINSTQRKDILFI